MVSFPFFLSFIGFGIQVDGRCLWEEGRREGKTQGLKTTDVSPLANNIDPPTPSSSRFLT